jgi:hypothetical protein
MAAWLYRIRRRRCKLSRRQIPSYGGDENSEQRGPIHVKKMTAKTYGRIGAMLLSALTLGALMLGACGKDDGSDSDADSSVIPAPATIDTPTTRSGAGPVDTSTAPPQEMEVRTTIEEKFDIMGGMEGVRYNVDGGAVTLEGTVKSADRKQTAEDVAKAVPGVVSVENNIRVEE